jgi:nucleotide-binding universal stress UspA family protein
MFLRTLVPLDGSSLAERALEMAEFLVRRTTLASPEANPLVILFRVVDPSPWLDLPGGGGRKQALEMASTYLEKQAENMRRAGLTVETAVRLGHPVEEVQEQVLSRKIDLIIMSTHGRSGLARWALGSVAERVVRSAAVPILLLPEAAPATLAAEPQGSPLPLHLLVPLDRSAQAEAALQPALELAHLLHAEVRLLYVMIPRFGERAVSELQRSWDVDRHLLHELEHYLRSQVELAQRAGVTAHWGLGYGFPGAKIIADAHTHQVQLIVMTTQGRGGLLGWRLGSVAEEVIHHGQLPVLLVPAEPAVGDLSKEDSSSSVTSALEEDRSAAGEGGG